MQSMGGASTGVMKVRGHVHEKYRLGPRLGVGGMADVFRAELTGAEGFSRPVAIKRLHPSVSSDPAFCAMFVREARLLAALRHPNIVSVLDFDWDAEGRLFLVMELVDGVTLSQLVQRGPLPPGVAEHVMAEVLRGLGHAHARGILHRDVTPHNVLLGWGGEVELSDFGLAQASASSRVSDGGLIRGKVPYLSPEQLQGLDVDARSDLFSVGVMSYQLLTGRYPFLGRTDQATMAESIARMLTATIVPPRDLRPEIPVALSDVVMRLLERERERRYMSADMVLAEMSALAHGREMLVELLAERFPGGVVDLASAGTWPVAGAEAGQAPDPWFRRHTVSLHDGKAQAGQRGKGTQRRGKRWWPGLALGLVALPLAWVMTVQWPYGQAPAGAVAAGGLDQASRNTGDPRDTGNPRGAGDADRAGVARGERLLAIETPRAPAASIAIEAGVVADAARPGHTGGHASGHAAGGASSRAGRAQPRRTPQRQHTAAIASTGTGMQADESLPAPAPPAPTAVPAPTPGAGPGPVQAPAEQRYERGWTAVTPQQTLTGEVPIRREAP
jgi:hypothetical protein